MSGPASLSRKLALSVSAALLAVWCLSILAMAVILKSEQEELFNNEVRASAELLHATLPARGVRGAAEIVESADADLEEALVYRLLDAEGRVLLRSHPDGPGLVFPDRATPGYSTTGTHVFFTTRPGPDGTVMQAGDPLVERSEAYFESILAFLLPMAAILPLGYLLVGWVARTSLRPVLDLRSEIGRRGSADLSAIDAADYPGELVEIVGTLNGFMIRLSRALEGERAFATNAAHELRTPVAVALAQVQRLRAETQDPDALHRIRAVEEALSDMAGRVARLLELSRAESGLGAQAEPRNLNGLLEMVVAERRRSAPADERLELELPDRPVHGMIDSDAFAIVAGNLMDNALRHSPEGTPVKVRLGPDGRLSVSNAGPAVPAARLAELKKRYVKGEGNGKGFGLGLHICDVIARQSGGGLTLRSPASGRADGFEAVFEIPVSGPRATEGEEHPGH